MRIISRLVDDFYKSPVDLGVVGDNLTTSLQINVSAWDKEFPNAVYTIFFLRQGDSAPYPVTPTYASGVITYVVTATETQKAGSNGYVQIALSIDGAEKRRTPVTTTIVRPNIGDAGETPPAPADTWLQSMVTAKNAAVAAKDSAQSSASAAAASAAGIVTEENSRVTAENARVIAEQSRASAETTRAAFYEGFSTQLADFTYQAVNTVFNADGSITETFATGMTKTTTFNADGTITEVYSAPINKTKTITFKADGSITEVLV